MMGVHSIATADAQKRRAGPPPSLRVLHAAEVVKGGVGSYLREVTKLQRSHFGGRRVAIVIPESQLSDLGAAQGVDVITFRDCGNRIIDSVRLAQMTRKVAAVRKPLIIHLHSTFAGAALRPFLAMLRSRAKVVYCPHGWAFDRDSAAAVRLGIRWLERTWSRWCERIVCVSEHERQSALDAGIPANKLLVVRNGLPAQSAHVDLPLPAWPEGRRRLLFVGRFDRQKGIDILLGALREMDEEVFAYIAGDSLRVDLGSLPGNAHYAGWLSPAQLEGYYASADVVVMPSRWEGLPLVALEAMRAGVPLIATSVGGIPEIVDHGRTGILIRPNDKRALIDALRQVDKDRLVAMGRAARELFLSQLAIEHVHRKLCEVYGIEAG
jgi:glycosyltransferase involved in cell wall biosynthesis